ncbi:MAG: hypothetical protein AB7C97_05170 [Oscillospiraceae bacterium]
MKNWKTIFAIVGVVIFVASAVAVCIVYWDKINKFCSGLKDKCCIRKAFTSEEYSDFADI